MEEGSTTPLGVALPVAMAGRLLQQACWQVSQSWDQPIRSSVTDLWKKWSRKTEHIHRYKIPRSVQLHDHIVEKQRLIAFVDASSEALAAVVYVQTLGRDGRLRARLLAAKGRVASLKRQESIPRMECAAAAMGAEFAFKVAKAGESGPSSNCALL